MGNGKMTQGEMIKQIYTVLLGVPNTEDKGLVGGVKDVMVDLQDLRSRHNTLNRKFWALVAGLVGSGIIGANFSGILGG